MSTQSSPEQLVAAANGRQLSLITLPRRSDCPPELSDVIAAFDAGDRPAATASARWLRESALDQHGSARAYLWLAAGQAHGFFAISVGTAKLLPENLTALDAGPWPLPAILLAQAARSPGGSLPAGAILTSALGVAERIAQYAGVAALILDPFDAPTSAMWQRRGFQPVLDKPPPGRQPRLWRALGS